MIGPTLILTSAHCFPDGTTSDPDFGVEYFAPGLDASEPRPIYRGSVAVHQHPNWAGRSASGWNKANHDIALVELTSLTAWPTTDYHDYLRIFQDYGADLPNWLELYGQGYATLSGNGMGTLRSERFEIAETNAYRLHFYITDNSSPCGGDSGAPYLVPGHELVAGVHSESEKDGPYCGQDSLFTEPEAACARTVWSNVGEFLESVTSVRCKGLNDGTYDYSRCFDIPFIEDLPNEGIDRGLATALTVTFL